MRCPRIWLGCLLLATVAACSKRNGAPDASGIAGDGGGSTGAGGQAGTSAGGGAGGQAGTSAGSGGTTGAAGQAGGGGSAGAGGAAGASAGTGGRGGSASGLGGQAGSSAGAGGAGGGTGGQGAGGDACATIVGTTFLSVDEMECGRGGLRCRWRVSFTATMYSWVYSDVGESGSYTCSGTTVTGQRFSTGTITGQYDPTSQILTWNGLPYTPQ